MSERPILRANEVLSNPTTISSAALEEVLVYWCIELRRKDWPSEVVVGPEDEAEMRRLLAVNRPSKDPGKGILKVVVDPEIGPFDWGVR